MGLFDKFKDLKNQVNPVENHLYSGKKDFLEIFGTNFSIILSVATPESKHELNQE